MTGRRQAATATRFIIWATRGLALLVLVYFVGAALK
jgi:uncharacterized membrane protein YjfL (UPF0719 family)